MLPLVITCTVYIIQVRDYLESCRSGRDQEGVALTTDGGEVIIEETEYHAITHLKQVHDIVLLYVAVAGRKQIIIIVLILITVFILILYTLYEISNLTKEISILGIFITFANAVTDDLYQKITRKLKL